MRPESTPVQGFSPAHRLLEMMTGHWIVQAIHVAAELGLADLVGRKPLSIDEIAQRAGAHQPSVYRLMRALASVGIFEEAAPRAFVTTPMAMMLRADMPGGLRDFALFQGASWHWNTWGGLLDSVRTGRPAISHVNGASDCFEYLALDPDAARVFDAAMNGYALQAHAAVVDAISFSTARLIVDVGGGSGGLLAEILRSAPQARGIVFDRPQVVTSAAPNLKSAGVSSRCVTEGGSFFESVPAGGDVYLLSSILHDWNDEQAALILKAVVRAMAPGASLLIIENVIPPGNDTHPGKLIDLEMMAITTGRERSEAEFRSLLDAAGLHFVRCRQTAVSACILEAHKPG